MNRTRERRRLIELRAQLARARDRDEITSTLCRAAALFTPRVALFGVKREGLLGLATPLGIGGIAGTVTRVSAAVEAAIQGESPPELVRDLDLRLTVGLESPDPCAFLPVRVGQRTVLMLYADREGDRFEPEERETLAELCQIAGYSLEMLLRSRAVDPPAAQATTVAAPPAAADPRPLPKATIVSLAEPLCAATIRGQIEIDAAERDGPWADVRSSLAAGAATPTVPPASATDDQGRDKADAMPIVVDEVDRPSSIRAANGPTPPAPSPDDADADAPDSPPASPEAIDAAIAAASQGSLDPDRLWELGPQVGERLAELFPGAVDRPLESLAEVQLPTSYGPLLRLCVKLGKRVGPYMLPLTRHDELPVRRHAVLLFQELRDDRCVHALSERAADDDVMTRGLAMRVLETYHASSRYPEALAPIRALLTSSRTATRLAVTEATGTLRDVDAVAALIAQLDDEDGELRRASLAALCSITGQQFGSRPHRWREWYAENAHRDRVAWLIDTLEHDDAGVRRWVAHELVRVTGRADPFPADGDPHARHAAISRWRRWWQASSGRSD
ncbi:MAG: HEAT repeat domain-containing protein [Myxococcales bacterium FL481]|nr:MAG: HEAT repeat domain-containing protein [Myxococcales bacterium FL481]